MIRLCNGTLNFTPASTSNSYAGHYVAKSTLIYCSNLVSYLVLLRWNTIQNQELHIVFISVLVFPVTRNYESHIVFLCIKHIHQILVCNLLHFKPKDHYEWSFSSFQYFHSILMHQVHQISMQLYWSFSSFQWPFAQYSHASKVLISMQFTALLLKITMKWIFFISVLSQYSYASKPLD